MSMDRSLKSKASLTRHRNVLTRAERLKKLTADERWDPSKTVFGLVKVAHRKAAVGKKEPKVKAAEGDAAAVPAAGAAAAAKPAAGGKAPAAAAQAKAPAKAAGKADAGAKKK